MTSQVRVRLLPYDTTTALCGRAQVRCFSSSHVRPCVLVYFLAADDLHRKLFLKEAETLATCQHPNIL